MTERYCQQSLWLSCLQSIFNCSDEVFVVFLLTFQLKLINTTKATKAGWITANSQGQKTLLLKAFWSQTFSGVRRPQMEITRIVSPTVRKVENFGWDHRFCDFQKVIFFLQGTEEPGLRMTSLTQNLKGSWKMLYSHGLKRHIDYYSLLIISFKKYHLYGMLCIDILCKAVVSGEENWLTNNWEREIFTLDAWIAYYVCTSCSQK